MPLPADEVEHLKTLYPGLEVVAEGPYEYVLIRGLKLPEGCSPAEVDALFCPTARDNYSSRLFLAQQVQPSYSLNKQRLNWSGSVRALERNWHAYSWQSAPGGTVAQKLAINLRAFT